MVLPKWKIYVILRFNSITDIGWTDEFCLKAILCKNCNAELNLT